VLSESSNARAVAAGLTYRSLATITLDTLEWFRTLPAERQANLVAGMTPEVESALLSAWHAANP